MKRWMCCACALMLGVTGSVAVADITHDYEGLSEGFYDVSFHHDGVTYHSVNGVSGVFPDGSTFEAGEGGSNLVIENAAVFYLDYPGYGSPDNSMTFGDVFIPGENLTIGALAQVWMDFDELSDSASLDIAYYENGPWGGIEYSLLAYRDGFVVGEDSFVISDLGGRDNPAYSTLSIDAVEFDQLQLRATYGSEFSLPRAMIDDLTFSVVPEPTTFALLGSVSLLALRRRR